MKSSRMLQWVAAGTAVLMLAECAAPTSSHARQPSVPVPETRSAGAAKLGDSRSYVFSPAEVHAFLTRAAQAEKIADPIQRCLAYPDPPGSHWAHAEVVAYCHFSLDASPVPPSTMRRLLRDGRATELERRLAKALHDQLAAPQSQDVLNRTYSYDFDSASPELRPLIDAWRHKLPRSAFALAASGFNHVAMASAVRGTDSLAKTPAADLAAMRQLLALADGELKKATRLNPELTPAYIAMMDGAMLEGRDGSGYRAANRALAADPASYLVPYHLMLMLDPHWGGTVAQQRLVAARAQARVHANSLLALLPVHAEAIAAELCYCADSKPAPDAYRRVFDKLGNVNDLESAGAIANWMAHYDAAVVYQSETLRFNPDDIGMRTQRVYTLGNQGDNQWALDEGIRLVAMDPVDPHAHLALGNAYEAMQDFADAERSFKEAIALDPHDMWLLNALGNLYVRKTHAWDKGWTIANQLIRSHPESPTGWILRASIQKDEPRPGLVDTAHYFLDHFSHDPLLHTQRVELRATLPKGDPYLERPRIHAVTQEPF